MSGSKKVIQKVILSLVASTFVGFASHAQDSTDQPAADPARTSDSGRSDWSFGGLFVEPALTYQKGDTTVDYPSPLTSSSGDAKGFGVGARLGAHIGDILFFGLDGRYSMLKFDDSTPYNANAKAWDAGPVLGIQTPLVGLRAWGSYILWGELDPDSSNSVNVKFADGKGYRLGVGFYVAVVSLNLEYQDLKYGKTTLEGLGSGFGSVNARDKTWIASVSFPIAM